MAKKTPGRWVYSPKSSPKPQVPEAVKKMVQAKGDALVETILKPRHIQSPPDDAQFSYIVDLYNQWYRSFFLLLHQIPLPGLELHFGVFRSALYPVGIHC